MDGSESFPRGVIEGFYGREWSWDTRRRYADYLGDLGMDSYLYCPKGDAHLRKQWRQPWPAAVEAELTALAVHYRERGLNWGVGLSPFALYADYSPDSRRALKQRIEGIDRLDGNILALLFDDMPGDLVDLAARQAEIVADVQAWTRAERLFVCPTYYSFDPVLEQFFGTMPEHYWADLGSSINPGVGLFWTGNRVCAEEVSSRDLSSITAHLGRKPVLWDNYPVNDGAKASKFLHLAPLPGRADDLPAALSGHFCNPMNQAELSRYPLGGLAALYDVEAPQLEVLYGVELAEKLARDQDLFQNVGLDGMSESQRQHLATEYAALGCGAALEAAAWLRGEYAFDPACLTG